MLILLGAAGGALRGLLDVYNRFLDWQSDRRAHRQSPAGQRGEVPRFADHFDPVADPVAAVVHSGMGAGAAVLFGTTGQISGAYAAMVVGLSAPVLLTQLGRVQSVADAVNGAPQAGTAEALPEGAPTAEASASAGAASRPSATQTATVTTGPPQSPPAASSPAGPAALAEGEARRRPDSTGPASSSPDFDPRPGTGGPQPNGRPVGPAGGASGAGTDHGAPRRPAGPVTGEEGTTR